MDSVGQIERLTQNRIVKLFKEQLGFEYLGNWEDRLNNSNIEENLEENFGLWQVPDANFISHLECPTTVDKGGLIYMIVARLEMLKAIIEGKKNKVKRIGDLMDNYGNSLFVINKSLVNNLIKVFG